MRLHAVATSFNAGHRNSPLREIQFTKPLANCNGLLKNHDPVTGKLPDAEVPVALTQDYVEVIRIGANDFQPPQADFLHRVPLPASGPIAVARLDATGAETGLGFIPAGTTQVAEHSRTAHLICPRASNAAPRSKAFPHLQV